MMTEKEFDQKVEDMAARFERRIEAAADRFDKGITRKYDESRLFRLFIRGTFIAAEIGLLIGAKHLADRGYKTAALWCAGLCVVCLAAEIVRILLFRRRK